MATVLSLLASRLKRGIVFALRGTPKSACTGALCIRADRGGVDRALVDGDVGLGDTMPVDTADENPSENLPRQALA